MMTLHICMSIYIFKFTKVFFMAELKETVFFFSDFKPRLIHTFTLVELRPLQVL